MPNSAVVLGAGGPDYAPYGQTADPTDLDTAIMATTPWFYLRMNDAQGQNFYDSSGNNRHAFTGVSPTSQQAAITSKSGISTDFANGWMGMQVPTPNLGGVGPVFTFMGLVQFSGLPAPGSAVGDQYKGSVFLHQGPESGTNFNIKLSAQDQADGASLIIQSGGGAIPLAGAAGRIFVGKPYVITLIGSSIPYTIYTYDVWLNGVKVISGYARYAATTGGYLYLGRLGNTQRLAQFRASNWACWYREMLAPEIMDLTECYLDKAAYTGSWKAR